MSPSRNKTERQRSADGTPLDRPLTPTSVIASLLLGMHPPRMRGALLVRWCAHLGIAEGTTRVALSRMVDAGELSSADGRYQLAGPLLRRQTSQDWSLAPRLERWDGGWDLHVVRPQPRRAPDRAALRAAAAGARLAELREGVWGRPANLPLDATPHDAAKVLAAQSDPWRAAPQPGHAPDPEALFALAPTAARMRDLAARLEQVTTHLGDELGDRLAEGFVVGAAALQQIRRDPLLPDALVEAAWPGARLRQAYDDYRERFGTAVKAWFAAESGNSDTVRANRPRSS